MVVYTQADGSYRAENLPFAIYTISAAPPGFQEVLDDGVLVDGSGTVVQDLVADPE